MKRGDEDSKIKELTYEDKVFSEHIYYLPEESSIRMYAHDITSRKRLESKYHQSRRDLVLLSRCNQLLVRASSEDELLEDVCEAIVQIGGYCLAWVGYAREDEDKSVEPVAQSGFNRGYLDGIDLTWAGDDLGQGPTGRAIRTGKPQTTHVLSDPDYEPWREEANHRGYASSIALPLVHEDTTYGTLNIYSTDPEAFEEKDEIELLSDLAKDLTFGIASIRERERRRSMEKELKDLSDHLLKARENERSRISRELHDELGQLTSTLIFSLRDYQNQESPQCDPGASDKIEEITNMVEMLDDKVKDLAVEIRPPSMQEFGLIPSLEEELEEMENHHRVDVDLAADEIDHLLDSEDQVHLYRTIQEAITNAIRHGNPNIISVRIAKEDSRINVTVTDDGSGFDTEEVLGSRETRSRLGLIGMRERVRSISGDLTVESTPGKGTTIELRIPIDEED
jgi:signal transduction histidine kinase